MRLASSSLTLVALAACRREEDPGPATDAPPDPPALTADTGATVPSTGPWTTTGIAHTGETETAGDTDAPEPDPCAPDPVVLGACSAGYAALVDGVGYADLDLAMDAAAPGSRVVVCPGTWPAGGWTLEGVRLEGADPAPGATVLDGGGRRHLLNMHGGGIHGLTLRGGRPQPGWGGGAVNADQAFVVECVTAEDNAGHFAGALYWEAEQGLVIRHSRFARNTAAFGGSIYALDGHVLVEDSTFEDNTSTNPDPANAGGVVLSSWRSVTVRRSTFLRNGSPGLHVDPSGFVSVGGQAATVVTVEDCAFDGNDGGDRGAFAVTAQALDLTVRDTTFTGNSGGAGVWVDVRGYTAQVAIERSTFAGNSGGGYRHGVPFAFETPQQATIRVTDTTFTDNTSTTGGAAIDVGHHLLGGGGLTVVGTRLDLLRNAGPGGAVSLRAEDLIDCTTCDLGAGADDNVPVDATKAGVATDELPLTFRL